MFDTKRDIDTAARALDEMAAATNIADFRTAWETILLRLEQGWERAKRFCEQYPQSQTQSWLSTNSKLRKTDPLLQYLKQARNSEAHGLAASVDSEKLVSITDRYGRPFRLNGVKVTLKDGTLTINLQSDDIGVDWIGKVEASTPTLQSIVCRGKRYDPPHKHLGNKISNLHPVFVATLGIDFYKGAYAALDLPTFTQPESQA